MKWLRELTRRLSMLVHRRQFDADLEEEMRLHLELRQQEQIESGMTQKMRAPPPGAGLATPPCWERKATRLGMGMARRPGAGTSTTARGRCFVARDYAGGVALARSWDRREHRNLQLDGHSDA